MKPLNLGLRLALELCRLVALGIWGFSLLLFGAAASARATLPA